MFKQQCNAFYQDQAEDHKVKSKFLNSTELFTKLDTYYKKIKRRDVSRHDREKNPKFASLRSLKLEYRRYCRLN